MMSAKESIQLKLLKGDFIKTEVFIKELIQEVRHCSGSQSELDELATLIRLKFGSIKEQIEELNKIYREYDNPEDRNFINKELEDWKAQSRDGHHLFRNALLVAQLAITQRNKDELFGTAEASDETKTDTTTGGSLRHRDKMSRELMMKKSGRLTDDLLTVTRMIRDNTEKSTKTLDQLVESSQMVTTTQEELKTMGSVIGQAKKILSKYERRENTDKLLIFLGLVFFLASCLVVIRNRFFFIF